MKSIILLCILPICLSHRFCDYAHYWSNEKESCLPCSKCPNHQLTVKPCQAHQNTICKSVSKFDLPWKKDHHKATIHFETDNVDDYDDDIYKDIFSKHMDPSGKPLKHSRKNFEKQRVNDKFLSWDDDKKHQKHKKHFEFGSKHHQKFDIFDDKNEDSKYRGNNHKKNVHRVKLEDEDILKQWLIQSKKQFKIKKDNMLKNLKEEEDDGDEWDNNNYDGDDWDDDTDWDADADDWDDDTEWDADADDWDYNDKDDKEDSQEKKIKLNYPLHKNDKKMENSHRSTPKRKEAKQLSDIDEDLFKDLIKNEDTGDLDVSTLLSNKRDPFAYKASPSVLGKPSTISEIIGQVKDPQELIKQEMGRNVIYEKSKISVLPISKEINDADVISVPFTAAERFVWDWQALALCSALFACLVFFIVVISYTIINARQWKRVKRNYSTELEEMSTKIALMQPTLEAVIAENPTKIESSQKH